MRTILAGRNPQAQGAILLELVATFIVGNAPPVREEQLAIFVDSVRNLIPIMEKIIFGEKGWPG